MNCLIPGETNTDLNAKDYFRTTRPDYHGNQFGATLGGPVLRNRMFFFVDVEANRLLFGQTAFYTIPTMKMRKDDLSELLSPALTNQTTRPSSTRQDRTARSCRSAADVRGELEEHVLDLIQLVD